jgi:hypothetical protein
MPVFTRIMLISALAGGLCGQTSVSPLDFWRAVRTATLESGGTYFKHIKGAEIPFYPRMFDGTVISKPAADKLVVNVDDPAGDAILISDRLPDNLQPGSRIHFKGVADSYTRQPYSLTLRYTTILRRAPEP